MAKFVVSSSSGGRRGGGGSSGGGVEYNPVQYDEGKLRSFQQEALAPGISQLKRQFQQVQAGRYSSPTARKEALRGATRGFGEALAPLQLSASQQAMARYRPEFEQEVLAEKLRFEEAQRERFLTEEDAPDDLLRQFGGVIPEGAGVELAQRLYRAGARPASTRSAGTDFTPVNRLPFTSAAPLLSAKPAGRNYNLEAANAELEQLYGGDFGGESLGGADLAGAFSRLKATEGRTALLEDNTRRI